MLAALAPAVHDRPRTAISPVRVVALEPAERAAPDGDVHCGRGCARADGWYDVDPGWSGLPVVQETGWAALTNASV